MVDLVNLNVGLEIVAKTESLPQQELHHGDSAHKVTLLTEPFS